MVKLKSNKLQQNQQNNLTHSRLKRRPDSRKEEKCNSQQVCQCESNRVSNVYGPDLDVLGTSTNVYKPNVPTDMGLTVNNSMMPSVGAGYFVMNENNIPNNANVMPQMMMPADNSSVLLHRKMDNIMANLSALTVNLDLVMQAIVHGKTLHKADTKKQCHKEVYNNGEPGNNQYFYENDLSQSEDDTGRRKKQRSLSASKCHMESINDVKYHAPQPNRIRHSRTPMHEHESGKKRSNSISLVTHLPGPTSKMMCEEGVPCPQGWGKTQICSTGGLFEWHLGRELGGKKWTRLMEGKQALFSSPVLLPAALQGWRTQVQIHRLDSSTCVNISLWLRRDDYNESLVQHLPLTLTAEVRLIHPTTGTEQYMARRDKLIFKKVGTGKILADVALVRLDIANPSIFLFRFVPPLADIERLATTTIE